jgi:hypothetical protein
MNVWVAISDPGTEFTKIAGVYTTEDAARAAAERSTDGRWSIESLVLDQVPDWIPDFESFLREIEQAQDADSNAP